jgi:GTPase SAR1 family protein
MTDGTIKCVITGNANVGKTSLLDRFLNDRLPQYACSTIGVECRVVKIPGITPLKIRFWDTAGCERFDAVTKIYYRGVDCAIVCYSEKDKESLDRVEYWVDQIRQENEHISRKARKKINNTLCCDGERYVELPTMDDDDELYHIPILLVATKCDNKHDSETFQQARELAERLHIQGPFFTSARSMDRKRIEIILQPFFRTVHRKLIPLASGRPNTIELCKEKTSKYWCCRQ